MLCLPQWFLHVVITVILHLLSLTCRHKLFLKDSKTVQHFNIYTGMFS